MKVLFVTDSLTSGGKERRLVELMKALKRRGDINFELAVMGHDIHYQEVFDLDTPIHYVVRKRRKDVAVFRKFYRLCKKVKPDIVHCWDSMSAIYLVITCKILNIKFVNGIVVDAPRKQNIWNKYWLRAQITFPLSNVVIGNSHAGLAAYRAPRKKSICIHNGFNFDRTEKILSSESIRERLGVETPYVIGMVASFSKNKDYQTFFNAAHLLLAERDDITFVAVGSGTDSENCRKLINESNFSHFKLLGRRSGIESLVNAMDICVLSTFTEGISNSIMEYMALGKPVVATRGGGTSEIVEDKETGFLIEPSSPGCLVEKIRTLLDDPALCERMGANGKERIRNYFSIDSMVNRYVSIYKNYRLVLGSMWVSMALEMHP